MSVPTVVECPCSISWVSSTGTCLRSGSAQEERDTANASTDLRLKGSGRTGSTTLTGPHVSNRATRHRWSDRKKITRIGYRGSFLGQSCTRFSLM